MLAAASIICATEYATLATPAVWPKKLHHPTIHAHIATCSGGTTCFVTKYMPPAVGYADTSSDTDSNQPKRRNVCRGDCTPELAIHIAMHDPMNQHHTAVAGPPELIGLPNVAGTEPRTPRTDMAYETIDHLVNSRRSSYFASAMVKEQLEHSPDLLVANLSKKAIIIILNRRHGWCCPSDI